MARREGAEVRGEAYLPLGSSAVEPVVDAIIEALPGGGIIINTLNGDSNVAFFMRLKEAGVGEASGFTIMNFSVAEEEVAAVGPEYLEGTYAVWNYFHGMDTPEADEFAQAFQESHGLHRITSDPAVSAYTMVKLWARAAERAGTTAVEEVRKALIGVELESPAGKVQVQKNHHLSKGVLIGRVQADGTFEIVERGGIMQPMAWSPLLEESQGYRCDWTSDREDAGKFRDWVQGDG